MIGVRGWRKGGSTLDVGFGDTNMVIFIQRHGFIKVWIGQWGFGLGWIFNWGLGFGGWVGFGDKIW